MAQIKVGSTFLNGKLIAAVPENQATLEKLTETSGELKYNGQPVVTKSTALTWGNLKGI